MEFYSLYQAASMIAALFSKGADIALVMLSGLAVGLGIWLLLFILQGIGLFVMAKRRNIKHKWLAFIPFANIYYMGKLAGECGFFGHKMKNAGLYAMLAQILASAVTLLYVLSEVYLYYNYGAPQQSDSMFASPFWMDLTGFALTVSKFYLYSGTLLSIINLIYQLMSIILVIALYKKYTPKNYFPLAFLAFFIPIARYITVFALRNREAIDYEEYMRKRREEFMRRQQQYYNSYGGPNMRSPYGPNPYGMGGYNGQPQSAPKEEDPFEEFASDNKGNTDGKKPADSGKEGGDDFFD